MAMPSTYKEGIARVSSIVESVFPFEWEDKKRFHKWLKSKDISPEIYMKVASEYGTAIHKGMEEHIAWRKYVSPEYEPQLTKYVGYGAQFLEDYHARRLTTEHYIWVENMFQWTIDVICHLDWALEEGEWIIDWKTFWIAQEVLGTKGTRWKYKKPYSKLSKARLQLSLYAYATGIKNIGVVELAEHWYVFHKLVLYSTEELENIINTFLWKSA